MSVKLLHADIVRTAKDGDFDTTLKLYDDAISSITSPPTWFIACPVSLIASSSKLGASAVSVDQVKRCISICEPLNLAESETLTSSLIRLCVCVGMIEEAVKFKNSVLAKKLRTFQPLLWFHANEKNVAELKHLWDELHKNGIEPTQAEFALMIEGGVDLHDYLLELARRFDEVHDPSLIRAITSRAASQDNLISDSASISEAGMCAITGTQLRPVGLSELQLSELLALTRRLVTESSKAVDITTLEAQLEERQNATVVLDGANIAHTNQNYAEGFFRFTQIEEVKNYFVTQEKQCLIVLHRKWLKRKTNLRQNLVEPANPKKRKLPPLPAVPAEQRMHDKRSDSESEAEEAVEHAQLWRQANELVEVPRGANDDWYWLYATLWLETKRRLRGDEPGSVILVSNDLMRDHLFRMSVEERLWEKFKHRHLCRFRIFYPSPEKSEEREYEFHQPPPFTRCIQLNGNFWHIPCKGLGYIVLKH